jgi:hypothetical protein
MLKIPHCAGMIDWGSWRPTPEITVGMALYQFLGICKPKVPARSKSGASLYSVSIYEIGLMETIQLFCAHHRKHEAIWVRRQIVPHVSETLSVIRTKALAIFENKQWRHLARL